MDNLNIIETVVMMIWLMLPASLSNPAAAVAVHFIKNPHPVDFGKTIGEYRLLGDGKTFEGLFCGIAFGILVAVLQNAFAEKFSMPNFPLLIVFSMPVGALLGDMVASCLKRRLKFRRGASFPLMDQLDFVFGAWLLTLIVDNKWFFEHFTLAIIISTLILIPIFHLIFNLIGYKIGVNREPW